MKKLLLLLGILLIATAILAVELPARALSYNYDPKGIQLDLADGAQAQANIQFANTDPDSLLVVIKSNDAFIQANYPSTFVITPGQTHSFSLTIQSLPTMKIGSVTLEISSATSSIKDSVNIPVKINASTNAVELPTLLILGGAFLVAFFFYSLISKGKKGGK